MTFTVLEVISDALQEVGVIGEGDTPEPDMSRTCLRIFQRMADRFAADGLMLFTVARTLYTLATSQQTRTIGPGGHFDTGSEARPLYIVHAGIIPVDASDEIPLVPYRTREAWLAEPWKAQTDQYPYRYWYERGNALGTFSFWPIPTTAAQIALSTPSALTAPAALTTSLAFPEGYHEAYHLNLAVRFHRQYRKQQPVAADLRADARDALAVVKRNNDPGPPPATFDAALTGRGGFDIQLGRYR